MTDRLLEAREIESLLSKPGSTRGRLQRLAYELLLEHERDGMIPTNGRFIFYELAQRGLVAKGYRDGLPVAKGKRDDRQNLADALMRLREVKLIPWSWIEDETRTLNHWDYAPSVAEYLRDRLEHATLNPWGDEPPPLILCESRSLQGPLRQTAYKYTCAIAATNGQAGGFLRTDLLPLFEGEPRRVLYLGDHDLAGNDIERNTRRVLEYELGQPLDWDRIAITTEQIGRYDVGEPMTKTDKRYTDSRPHLAWETEALGQKRVVEIVVAALDERLPEPLVHVRERELDQRQQLRAELERWTA
ncbi:MAG TPA: hypothetical protein VNI55_14505 [Gaiellaceae bacterium]|nr:hypothetical protein [Gaiellaceae bacterium]